MKPLQIALGAVICLALIGSAQARDTRKMLSINEALTATDADGLGDDIQLFFGNQSHPTIKTNYGNFMSNKKSRGFGKSDRQACMRAFASAMLSFQRRARTEGGNAVVNLTSYYKKNSISSTTEFECGSGALMSGVTFKGDVVRLK